MVEVSRARLAVECVIAAFERTGRTLSGVVAHDEAVL